MAWYDWFVGTPKVVEQVATTATEVVKQGVGMIDNAWYTDQEKAETNLKMVDIWMKLQTLLANDSGVSAVARRAVAFLIMLTFCLLVIMAAVVYKIDKEWSAFILKLIQDSNLGWLVMAIGVFFFGAYVFGKYTKWGTTDVLPKADCPTNEEKKEDPT